MHNRILHSCFIAIIAAFLLNACGKHHHAHEEEGLQWPELSKLDMRAEKCEALLEAGHQVELKEAFSHLEEAVEAFLKSSMPDEVKNEKILSKHISDLRALFAGPENHKADTMIHQVKATHPLVAGMMEAAGMPHVHDHECCGHEEEEDKRDHEEHDHEEHHH